MAAPIAGRVSAVSHLLSDVWPIVGEDVKHTCSRESCPRECEACRLEFEGWRLLFLSYALELGLTEGEQEVERGTHGE